MLRLKDLSIVESKEELRKIPEGKVLINTIYAYSYVVAQKDKFFADALRNCDYLMPDGASIVKACAALPGLADAVYDSLKIPCAVADDPQTSVVMGCGRALEDTPIMRSLLDDNKRRLRR